MITRTKDEEVLKSDKYGKLVTFRSVPEYSEPDRGTSGNRVVVWKKRQPGGEYVEERRQVYLHPAGPAEYHADLARFRQTGRWPWR